MYWDTEIEYLAFGMGACDFIDNVRMKRPKTIGSYYRYV
jgi:coproporphyrinogen III oxidase-like Fe-S oxidoreductase